MAKPTYEEVIEQRNAAREEVETLTAQLAAASKAPTYGMADALARVAELEKENATIRDISEKLSAAFDANRIKLEELEKSQGTPDSDKARRFDEMRSRVEQTDFNNPEERARFLSEFQVETPNTEPDQDPAMGDLTPAWARWRIKTATKEECRTIYQGRSQYLPDDVREYLQAE